MESLPFKIRPLREGDWHFVLSSWLRSFAAGKTQTPKFWAQNQAFIEDRRQRGATFLVACDPDDEDFIFGWSCAEGPVLHYVYVKEAFRHAGVARALAAESFPCSTIWFTHQTNYSDDILKRHAGALKYVPLR